MKTQLRFHQTYSGTNILSNIEQASSNRETLVQRHAALLFAVQVSSLCPQADASGRRLRRNHLPVMSIYEIDFPMCCDQVESSRRVVQFGRGNVADIVREVVRRQAPFASRRRWQCSDRKNRERINRKELSSTFLREEEGENRSWSPFCALPSASIFPLSSQPLGSRTERTASRDKKFCQFYVRIYFQGL